MLNPGDKCEACGAVMVAAGEPFTSQWKVQARRNNLSQDWYDAAPGMAPEDVEQANREYGWRKFRVVVVFPAPVAAAGQDQS